MIRWGYLLPRVVLFGTLAVAACLGIGPALRYVVTSSIASSLGADARVERVRFDVSSGTFVAENVRVASPGENSPAFTIAEARVDLDAAAITRRRLIVDEISATGVVASADEIGACLARTRLDLSPPPLAVEDLAKLLACANLDPKVLLDQSETFREGETVVAEWNLRLELLKRRAKLLEAKAALLHKESAELRVNPLRAVERLASVAKELEGVRTESETLIRELKDVPKLLEKDRERLRAARGRDLAKLRAIPKTIQADPRTIAEGLIGEDRLEAAEFAYRWASAIRTIAETDLASFEPQRAAGRDVLFPSLAGEPDLLVRRFRCEGTIRSASEECPFALTVGNWTPQPRRLAEPLSIDLAFERPFPTRVRAVLDRTGDDPRDAVQVAVRSPGVSFTLGEGSEWALAASAEEVLCEVSLTASGDRVAGTATIRHRGTALRPLGDAAGRSELAHAIGDAVSEVDAFDVAVRFDGTWREPNASFECDLGTRLAPAFERAATRRLVERRAELETRLARQFDEVERRALDRIAAGNRELAAAMPKLPELGELERTLVERLSPALAVPREALKLPNLLRR